VELVDPFIGSGGLYYGVGSGFMGASLPFGMAKPGPDTTTEHGAVDFHHCSGYHYDDPIIDGFSQVNIHGIGVPDYGALLFMPTIGFDLNKTHEPGYRSAFSKDTEEASPGYYAVTLDDTGIRVELTATTRCAVHRYAYPAGTTDGYVVIDLSHALQGCSVSDSQVQVDGPGSEVAGFVHYVGNLTGRSGGFRLYFAARFNQPLESWTLWRDLELLEDEPQASGANVGAGVQVKTDTPVEIRIGLSYVDLEGARNNLEAEAQDNDFDSLRDQAREFWNTQLRLVDIQGGNARDRTMFYTALYHAMLTPTLFTDADGRYTGFDKLAHQAEDFTYYTDFSMWDTYRTVHSLFDLILPARQRDMLISLLTMKDQGGYLPKWPAATGYTGCMIGTPADIVITESYLKGITDFDAEAAYAAIKQNATTAQPAGGRAGILRYLELGYLPSDEVGGATSRTLEFAVADAAIARFAAALGHDQDAADFAGRAQNYRNVWDPETQFMRGRLADGSWAEATADFDPLGWDLEYYTEGDAWQYLWLVPHDPAGLAELFGSNEAMYEKLEAFFSTPEPEDEIYKYLPKIYYWHGNEPDLHAAYLFDEIGRPDRTQHWVRHVLETRYGIGPDGLAGNDDCGTLSAWYVFSSSGFYPIAGQDFYLIGSPIFERTVFDLGSGKTFEVIAQGASPQNKYIQSARLNDRDLESPRFTHADIAEGGRLELVMGPEPSAWGR
jgi:predicted alpha-1,2-mannosidase